MPLKPFLFLLALYYGGIGSFHFSLLSAMAHKNLLLNFLNLSPNYLNAQRIAPPPIIGRHQESLHMLGFGPIIFSFLQINTIIINSCNFTTGYMTNMPYTTDTYRAKYEDNCLYNYCWWPMTRGVRLSKATVSTSRVSIKLNRVVQVIAEYAHCVAHKLFTRFCFVCVYSMSSSGFRFLFSTNT